MLIDSPGQTQVAWLTRGAASFERAPSAPCRSCWGGWSTRLSSQSVSRAHPSVCCAPRCSDSITVGSQYPYRCPTRSPSDCWSPRRPRDISGDSSWPGLLRSCHSGYRPATRCHTITLSASGTALAVLEDWDPRRPASWIGVLLRGGRDTTWSLVLIPIDLLAVAALIRVRCCLTALARRTLRG